MKRLTAVQEDVLADALRSLHLRSTLYCRAALEAPWGIGISRRKVASFHVVTAGTCWLTTEGMSTPVLLTEGDLVILPHGHAHTLTDAPGSPVTRLEDLEALESKHVGDDDGAPISSGRGPITTLVCGGFELEAYPTHPVFALLPTWMHLRNRNGRPMPLLRTIVRLVQSEARENRLAADMIITRLSEILFIQAVRMHLDAMSDGSAGWLRALKDPQIGQAIALIQHQPEQPWTVESLADRVSLSRSAFSAKFKQLVGEPPMQYVTRMRLTKGAVLLRRHAAPLMQVALAVGYESEVTFSKAFKRYFGVAPGTYRQGTRSLEADSD